jgi:hypothetical protein
MGLAAGCARRAAPRAGWPAGRPAGHRAGATPAGAMAGSARAKRAASNVDSAKLHKELPIFRMCMLFRPLRGPAKGPCGTRAQSAQRRELPARARRAAAAPMSGHLLNCKPAALVLSATRAGGSPLGAAPARAAQKPAGARTRRCRRPNGGRRVRALMHVHKPEQRSPSRATKLSTRRLAAPLRQRTAWGASGRCQERFHGRARAADRRQAASGRGERRAGGAAPAPQPPRRRRDGAPQAGGGRAGQDV